MVTSRMLILLYGDKQDAYPTLWWQAGCLSYFFLL